MRGLKGGNYWVLESTAGPRGGENASVMLEHGEMRDESCDLELHRPRGRSCQLLAMARCAEWWRTKPWSIVDVDGEPDPIYEEYKQLGEEF
jgi:hypothetical protein